MSSKGHPEIRVSHPNIEGSMTIQFEPRAFGIQYEGNMISDVVRKSQADIAGVQIGWAIMSVNGQDNLPDSGSISRLFDQSKKSKQPTTVCFGKHVVVEYKSGMGIRKGPAYPGDRAKSVLKRGQIVAYSETKTFDYQGNTIKFYKMTNGQGWLHNYNHDTPKTLDAALEVGHVKVMYAKGISIRQRPIYPGKRTDHSLRQGLIVGYTHRTQFDYNGISIKFYKLADGRGWIHNFNPDSPTSLDTVQELEAVKSTEKQGELMVSGGSSLFELHGDTLYYFQGSKDQEPEGIALAGANISVGGSDEDLTFTISTSEKKTFLLKAKDKDDKEEWLGALAAALGQEREEKSGESIQSRYNRLRAENIELRTLVEELEGHIAAVTTAASVTTSTSTTSAQAPVTIPNNTNPPQRAVWI